LEASLYPFDRLGLAVKEMFKQQHAVRIRHFPCDPKRYVQFLGQFGTPMPNYKSKSGIGADEQDHAAINRVIFKPPTGERQLLHQQGGPLPVHSARSWSKIRPALFAMLMVHPGWLDQPRNHNGETVLVRWRDVIRVLREAEPLARCKDFKLLSQTPLPYMANNVREAISDLPLIYPLPDAEDECDWGVRIKYDLTSKLETVPMEGVDRAAYRHALVRFLELANQPLLQCCFQLQAGELVLIDNHRWGHGRRAFVTDRESQGKRITNPRELWSVTVASRKFSNYVVA
jgi:hypothetical protein